MLFVAGTAWPILQVAVQSVGTGERRNLIPGGTQPRYARSGHLVYAQGGNLMAVTFDPQRLTVTGATVPVVEGVLQSPTTGAAQYSMSATGSLVYVPGGAQASSTQAGVGRSKGCGAGVARAGSRLCAPRLSPDGQRVAVRIEDSESTTNLGVRPRPGHLDPVDVCKGSQPHGAWTLDGKRIAFGSNEGPFNLFWQLADGSGGGTADKRRVPVAPVQTPGSWSPDGQLLAFIESIPRRDMTSGCCGSATTRRSLSFEHRLTNPCHSFPQTVAGSPICRTNRAALRFMRSPIRARGAKRQISTEGGTEPVWNRNGRELFYRSGNKMMAVDITTHPGFTAGKPQKLFEGPYLPSTGAAQLRRLS